jgi:hypothetical protein
MDRKVKEFLTMKLSADMIRLDPTGEEFNWTRDEVNYYNNHHTAIDITPFDAIILRK